MPRKTIEQRLFELVHSTGDREGEDFSIIRLDDEDSIRYRCECRDLGVFEIAQMEGSEDYNIPLEDWEVKNNSWYLYSAKNQETGSDFPIDYAMRFLSIRIP